MADGRQVLTVRMTRGSLGVWEVEIIETDSSRRIATSHDNEVAARRAIEVVYQYGRQFGQWRIERRRDYVPNTSAGPVSPVGVETSMDAARPSRSPDALSREMSKAHGGIPCGRW